MSDDSGQSFVAVVVGGVLALAAYGWLTNDMNKIRAAAYGLDVDKNILAEAYWRQQSATHVPKSEWILLNRYEKSKVYKRREDLRDLFERMPTPTQEHVRRLKPKKRS